MCVYIWDNKRIENLLGVTHVLSGMFLEVGDGLSSHQWDFMGSGGRYDGNTSHYNTGDGLSMRELEHSRTVPCLKCKHSHRNGEKVRTVGFF